MNSFSPLSGHRLKAVLGPTNTGKTHYAIERMLAYRSGMIGLPLRLLAREVYQKVCAQAGVQAVALVTGEERIVPKSARYWVATVEAMPLDVAVDCLAVDEIQTATDFDRGHIFTHRILNARGRQETLLLGSSAMIPVVRMLLPDAEIIERPRLSQLTYAGPKKITRQPGRSAIVAFSASEVYAIAELVRRERGGAAVVMGALSPRTRNAQVELYQNGDVDFLVATDAIGMGLNLDVKHVAFAGDAKFDGRQHRPLTAAEIGQIAGRAGRHMRDGTFGVTGRADAFDPEMAARVEAHEFDMVRVLQWRNDRLDFASMEGLMASLEIAPPRPALTLVPAATDQRALEFVSRNEAGALARQGGPVDLLWACCQIPDYRDLSPAHHGEIVTRIYCDLTRNGVVDTDWIAEQVGFCDNVSGDLDTLSNRIRQVRTWTFVANHHNWLDDPVHWREKTRAIEDQLSDALHERLTQRFVDRRTSILIRHLRDKSMPIPEVSDRGEISIDGQTIGTIEGFRFTLTRSEDNDDAKGLAGAAASAVAPEILKRAERLCGGPNEEFVLTNDGYVRWRGEIVGELVEGDEIFAPRVLVLADEALSGAELSRVQDRLNLWLKHLINTQLEPVIALASPPELDGTARGIAFQLSENLGILPRQQVANEVKALDQDVRGVMRKMGVKFGAYHIYVPISLKPAPRELALALWALKNGGVRQPGVSDLPNIVLSGRTSFEIDSAVNPRLYEIAGFKVAGRRAVRVDILERLADIIRPLISQDANNPSGPLLDGAAERNGFRVTVEMTSLLGCAGEDFASILKSLGYRLDRREKVPAANGAAEAAGQAEDAAATSNGAAVAEDATDKDALAAVEGSTPPTPKVEPETEPVAAEALQALDAPTRGDESEGEPPVAELADVDPADADAAEPVFDEVWFPGGRRPDKPRHDRSRPQRASQTHAAQNHAGQSQAGQRQAGEEPAGQKRPGHARGNKGFKGNRHPNGGTRGNGAPGDSPHPARGKNGKSSGPHRQNGQNGGGNDRSDIRPQRREKPIDPDSPFAALAALKLNQPNE